MVFFAIFNLSPIAEQEEESANDLHQEQESPTDDPQTVSSHIQVVPYRRMLPLIGMRLYVEGNGR